MGHASGSSAGKRFGEARDRGGIFGDIGRFRAIETALSRVSGGKAAESQRLFRTRQETGFAQDCVVGLAGLEPATPAGTTLAAPVLPKRFKGALILNGDYDAHSADAAIARGNADLIAFGVPFLANPDLPARYAERAPLNAPDQSTFYSGEAKGYIDYSSLALIREFAVCGNREEAERRAGYKAGHGNAARILNDPRSRALLNAHKKKADELAEIHLAWVLANVKKIAGVNIRELMLFDATGAFLGLDLQRLSSEQAYAISEIGFDADGRPKIKFHDKVAANKLLHDHLAPMCAAGSATTGRS
jgi:Terminase small subunit/NADH:flavin oxidoreductase / NADH oxidase family